MRLLSANASISSAQLRYANNSNYKNDTVIKKEVFVSSAVLDELRRIIEDSEVRSLANSCTAENCAQSIQSPIISEVQLISTAG